MKVGDIVEITKGHVDMADEEWFFRKGNKAKLIEQDADGDWWGDFNNLGNDYIYDDGIWCITERGECVVVQEA